MVFDSLDGWVARRLRTSTEIGAQLDSLCDAVTFGVVPGVLFKTFVEDERADHGHPLSLLLGGRRLLCPLRRDLASRDSTSTTRSAAKTTKPSGGLPSPGAAIVVVATVLFHFDERWVGFEWIRDNAQG